MSLSAGNQTWIIPDSILPHAGDPGCVAHDAVFTLANGRFGCRGTLPGAPVEREGTYIGGLYDDCRSYRELDDMMAIRAILGPNVWYSLFDGQPCDPSSIARTLDMKTSSLHFTGEILRSGRTWRLEGERIVSWHDRRVAVERLALSCDDPEAELSVTLGIDDTAMPRMGGRAPFEYLACRETSLIDGDCVLYTARTQGERGRFAVATAVESTGTDLTIRTAANFRAFEVRGKGSFEVIRWVGLDSSVMSKESAQSALDACRAAMTKGFVTVKQEHAGIVESFWADADIGIDGPLYDQRALRFCIHAIGSALPDSSNYSMGAKLLSGMRYWGTVFWDTDQYIIPVLTRMIPEAARRHLEWRYRGLDQARSKARSMGFAGAKYPWSAVNDGREANVGSDGRMEIHIVGGVAWALVDYYEWTRDQQFMDEMGAEMLAECARFWSSVVCPETGSIRKVIPPDEWAVGVDNCAYTNYLARHTLEKAVQYCRKNVTEEEISAWAALAPRIVQQKPGADGLIEHYDGYFALPDPDLRLDRSRKPRGTQVTKQASVIMLQALFPDAYSRKIVEINYDYHEARCAHSSTLSSAPHAIVAARLGRTEEAYRFFLETCSEDLQNPWPNVGGGIHGAPCGGAMMAVLMGFAGIAVVEGSVSVNPALPEQWQGIRFRVRHGTGASEVRISRKASIIVPLVAAAAPGDTNMSRRSSVGSGL